MKPAAELDVFISYSNADAAWAEAVVRELEAAGLRCWIAPRDIVAGDTWSGAIVSAIQRCRVMVLVFSQHSNNSMEVTRELVQAAGRGVHILPLRVDDVQPSTDKAYYLGAAHWLTVLGGPSDENLARLRKDVLQRLGAPAITKQGADAQRGSTASSTRAPRGARSVLFAFAGAAAVVLVAWSASTLFDAEAAPKPDPSPPIGPDLKGHGLPKRDEASKLAESLAKKPEATATVEPAPTPPADDRWRRAPATLRRAFEPLDAEGLEIDGAWWPKRVRHVATGIEFALVPGGEFELGALSANLDTRDEQPVRRVAMSPFYLGRREVSLAQYSEGTNTSTLPVVGLTAQQAEAWCAKHGLALPTEAQWEYAASGAENRVFPWGDTWSQERCNAKGGGADGFNELAPIDSFGALGASWCGVENLAGNVSEWCRGTYASGYADHRGDRDPEPPTRHSQRVARGGSWMEMMAGQRTSDRRPYPLEASNGYVGFRCAFRP
jgi:formylglycine-generating enzyme required for sulfatase activity